MSLSLGGGLFPALLSSAQAGDILRGGATISSSRKNAAARANAGAAEAAEASAAAKDRLARTTQAVQAVQAMQTAARGLANNLGPDPNRPGFMLPDVPDGLGAGGLDLLGAPTGANAPTQSGTKVTVRQTAQQAILNWKTFNIGKKTTLYFDQRQGGSDAGKWIAFNKVSDPSGSPSQIMGSIKAEGQVYIINQNGIIFGAGSQVNVRTLVASSLPINDNLITNGLLNNPDAQFLFSALAIPAGSKGTPAFTPPPPPAILAGRHGDVTVQRGAQLVIPTSDAGTGGRVALIGPNVTNEGLISTPDGQIILAAGMQVGIDAHATSDPSLRGLDIYIGKVTDGITSGGTAINRGLMDGPRANITMAGKDVQQLGVITSSTSVSVNGRIDLLANYDAVGNIGYDPTKPALAPPFLFKSTGTVTLGANSVTQILPEIWSTETITGTKLALPSQINLQGLAVYLGVDAVILAPNANVGIRAGKWGFKDSPTNPLSQFVYTAGQIYLDTGALIDVAGTTGVVAAITQNIMTLELRGAEFADSPLQRDGVIRGVPITVDLRKAGTFFGRDWVGTPLGDATGFVGLIERTVAQLTTAGGNVDLKAGGSVVLREGSLIDVSGGYVRYEEGMVKTTRLRIGGNIINIEDATPDRAYDGIFTSEFTKSHAKWGISRTYSHALAPTGAHFEKSYLQGADAGSISITAPAMALDGDLVGQAVAGPRQVRKSASTSTMPKLASLSLIFQAQDPTPFPGIEFPLFSPTPPDIIFQPGTNLAPADSFALNSNGEPLPLRSDRSDVLFLSPELLTKNGFGSLTVNNSDGNIDVPAGITLAAPTGGSITLLGANINIQGQVRAAGGTMSFTTYNFSPYQAEILKTTAGAVTPAPDVSRGLFTLGAEASLNVAGLVVDDRPTAPEGPVLPMQADGGQITITTYTADLAEGSLIDASGGIRMTAHGKRFYGNGGSISILAGQDPKLKSILGGQLKLGATLKGYSGAVAGALTIQAPLIQVGGGAASPETFLVTPDFFNQGGFGSFTLIGIGAATADAEEFVPAVWITPGTVIEPVVQGWVADPHAPGGKGLAFRPVLRPEGLRTPVSLNFKAPGVKDDFTSLPKIRGDIVMGEGARILTDAGGSVTFDGQTVAILGSIIAPGGIIKIKGADTFPSVNPSTFARVTVYLGPQSVLSTAGKVLLQPDPFGRRIGTVLPGGLIEVAGNILADSGAVLDVSGAAGILDLTPAELGLTTSPEVPLNSGLNAPLFALQTTPTLVESNGGAIILKGSELLVSDATLLGRPGGPTALGGFLSVSSGRFVALGEEHTTADINLVVTQNGSVLGSGPRGIGLPVMGRDGQVIKGMGYFAANRFAEGGFSSLELGGNVLFSGPVSITAEGALLIGSGGVVSADSAVSLTAAYIRIGQEFRPPPLPEDQIFLFTKTDAAGVVTEYTFPPTPGPGSLSLNAPFIDVGTLILQGISRALFAADGGDIRGDGTLAIAGDLILRAAQVYPASAVDFNIFAYDANGQPGSVTIEGSGIAPLPLSAGGNLTIMASIIRQAGTLRAPLGTISLGWDGTGTAPTNPVVGSTMATPVTQLLTLAPGSVTSVSAIDPLTGEELLIPFGMSPDGLSWLAPSGLDVTVSGLPAKGISLAAQSLQMLAGSVVDIQGGGDLYAYRWVQGLGGTTDILASENSFAILPGYLSRFAPYAAFNTSSAAAGRLLNDPGYVNENLAVGDQIYLSGSDVLPAGTYTLLPARYALLPGAVLVTPREGPPPGLIEMPDGSRLVSGYRFNGLAGEKGKPATYSAFEILSSAGVRTRSEYEDYTANAFLSQRASELGANPQRLPDDSGHLVLQAVSAMTLNGSVLAKPAAGARGANIDIAADAEIWIADGGVTVPAGAINLSASLLSSWGAESLLIGATRSVTADGTTLNVRTPAIIVDNGGSVLAAPEVILAALKALTLAPDATVASSGRMTSPSADLILTGDGTLLRVAGNGTGGMLRTGFTGATDVAMTIGAGASISGASITLDSTYATELDPLATLFGQKLALNSGQVIIRFDSEDRPAGSYGLVLSGEALDSVLGSSALSLTSYTAIDIYGAGTLGAAGMSSLALHAGEIRGFNLGGGTVILTAENVLFDNAPGALPVASSGVLDGTLSVETDILRIGKNTVLVSQFADLLLNADGGIMGQGTGGLETEGNLLASTPILTASQASSQKLAAKGTLTIVDSGTASRVSSGLGATYVLEGTDISLGTDVLLPSGALEVHATAGGITISGSLDLSGVSRNYFDIVKYTDGGNVILRADSGDVVLNATSRISVAAPAGGGSAGSLTIATPLGQLLAGGTLVATAGTGGENGSFSLDVLELPSLAPLNALLDAGSFTESRAIRVRTGDVLVDGTAKAHSFSLSTDIGSITVSGTVDASGAIGGEIALAAHGSVTLLSGSLLTVAAQDFNNAGKGGSVRIEAGTQRNGVVPTGSVLDIQAGSTIDLSVASLVAGNTSTPGSSAFEGRFSGTLHLRAPQNAAGTDLQVNTILGTITGASSILVEGYKLFDLTSSGGSITGTRSSNVALPSAGSVQRQVYDNGLQFLGAAGTTSAGYSAMLSRLLGGDPQGLSASLVIAPGAELINRNGDLTLGSASTTHTSDWILSDYRFGPRNAAGVLTLRASGDLVFYNAVSDGFTPVSTSAATGNSFLWLAPLMFEDASRPANLQSYSLRLTAGADLSSASHKAFLPVSALAAGKGSLLLGRLSPDGGLNLPNNPSSGADATTASAIATNRIYQVIRTGTGDIDISAARDVQFRNQLASIYTAGVGTPTRTKIFAAGDFVTPVIVNKNPVAGNLGAGQQSYDAYYSYAGGNVRISARNDITRVTQDNSGAIIPDSSNQLPVNWLNRRGYVDPVTGLFGVGGVGNISGIGAGNVFDPSASTTWWINFSNFFEGVGTLGGGNIVLDAGRDIFNVDAAAPTNARMAGRAADGTNLAPDLDNLLEWGGGDISVSAGRDVSGGVYYVERGHGSISAGASVTTNANRSPSLGRLNAGTPEVYDASAWIPTMLFVGKGGFDVSAKQDILIGPAANPFLLPPGLTNKFYYKTYFNTFDAGSYLNVTSLGGDVTHRLGITLPTDVGPRSTLSAVFSKWLLMDPQSNTTEAYFHPWLRLSETDVSPFATTLGLSAPTLRSTALSGEITIAGDLTLFPSPTGTLELVSAKAINGLALTGVSNRVVIGSSTRVWSSATINVSDANPASIPGIVTPFAYHVLAGRSASQASTTATGFLTFIDSQFAESGSYIGQYGVIQTKQALHAQGVLHAGDASPLLVYAGGGDISGLTLFSPKKAQIFAARDITDIAFYVQNTDEQDASIVNAGRDLLLYNANTAPRAAATTSGNALAFGETALAGDIQISGPGLLEVLAGRHLDLGAGPNNEDGTGVGITSVGNARNPYLPFTGASLIIGAGIGPAAGLTNSDVKVQEFLEKYLNSEFSTDLGEEIASGGTDSMTPSERAQLALRIFYLVLRDTGRNFAETGNYEAGFQAIHSLFGDIAGPGDINTRSRDIRTKNGGDISIFAPGGKLVLASSILGNPLTPPGIVTETGGRVSIFTEGDVDIGQARIFTLRGGDMIIWSSAGDIAAGSAAKTVQTAPPTRVIIDPQSALVETDLAGLATGGGIGVLSTVKGVPPGDVDLIAPEGVVDAGDAGIRVSGDLNIAAVQVLNADNISVQGSSAGVPVTPAVAAPNIAGLSAASNTAGASTSALQDVANQALNQAAQEEEVPSIITAEVLGYGGEDSQGY